MRWGLSCGALLVASWTAACASHLAPTRASVDVLDFLVGDFALWPRYGDQHQHQIREMDRVCWTKYTLGWSFECWRWDDEWIYHEVDHAIDGNRRWEHYTFSDGRWLPRWLAPGEVWELDVAENRIRWVDAACEPQPERAFPYRVRAWMQPAFDAGGDLGTRDVVILEYQPDPAHAAAGTMERFYLARGAGWFLWTRADGVRIAFNRLGGVARPRTPWCARDFTG
jgi:hypothetical protein